MAFNLIFISLADDDDDDDDPIPSAEHLNCVRIVVVVFIPSRLVSSLSIVALVALST